jgi:hypothetical protein
MTLIVSAEEALLITVAGRRCALPVEPRPGPLRWERVLELAQWHRLLPLLWEHVREPDPQLRVPDEVVDVLRDSARESTARSLNLQHEMGRILALLGREGVPVMLLKGAALVETVYPHPGQRTMVDLDLLVPRSDIQRAHAVVQTLGYSVGGARVARDDDHVLATYHHHYPLRRDGGAVIVELHQGLVDDRPDFDVQGIWDRAWPSDHGGHRHLLQAPEDLALHVAMHFAKDRMSRHESALGQLADLVRIVERLPIDWDVTVDRARASCVADRLFVALASAQLLFGDLAPPDVVASLQPASYTAERGELMVRRRVLTAGPSLPLESLSRGLRRMFPPVLALEGYVRPDEPTPSTLRLRGRRWRSLARRLVTQMPHPRDLVREARLSRWMVSLRR